MRKLPTKRQFDSMELELAAVAMEKIATGKEADTGEHRRNNTAISLVACVFEGACGSYEVFTVGDLTGRRNQPALPE